MATEIKNAEIMFVSLVDKAANKRKFAIIKSDDGMNFEKNIPIIKKDDEKQIVTGVVYAPNELDSQNEFMTAETIEKAAHKFMTLYRNIDKQHNEQNGYAEVIESWIAKEDGKIGEQSIKKGTWLASVHVTDTKMWEEVKKGEITGFSMGGIGERIEYTNKVNKEEDGPEIKGFFNAIKNFFTGEIKTVEKAGRKISGKRLESIKSAVAVLNEIIAETDEIENINLESEDNEVKKEEMQEIIKAAISETIEPINEEIKQMKQEDEQEVNDKFTKDDAKEFFKSAIEEALKPIKEEIENIKMTRNLSRQSDNPNRDDKVEKSFWSGLDI